MTKKVTKKRAVTLQSLFNKAVKGLAKQGFKQALVHGRCIYLAKNGARCAIGHLVTKKVAASLPASSYNSNVAQYMPSNIAAVLDQMAANTSCIGVDLQSCHDTHIDPKYMKEALVAFAERYHLTLPKELL